MEGLKDSGGYLYLYVRYLWRAEFWDGE